MIRIIIIAVSATILGGCSDADVASSNLSRAADQFELTRRIVFYNGITDSYMLTVEGLCSIKADRQDNQLEVTCKTGEEQFKKHFLGLSDNVTYFAEQIESASMLPAPLPVTYQASAPDDGLCSTTPVRRRR